MQRKIPMRLLVVTTVKTHTWRLRIGCLLSLCLSFIPIKTWSSNACIGALTLITHEPRSYEGFESEGRFFIIQSARQGAQDLKKVLKALEKAARFVRAEDYLSAVNALEDLLHTQPVDFFGFRALDEAARSQLDIRGVRAQTEEEFQRRVLNRLSYVPFVHTGTFQIGFPRPYRGRLGGLSPYPRWATRSWLRMASEELIHAAQFMFHALGTDGLLSRLLRENPELRRRIYEHGERLNQDRATRGLRRIEWLLEADAYAVLIENFGEDLIPVWVGRAYEVRRHIDETFTERGLNRVWEERH